MSEFKPDISQPNGCAEFPIPAEVGPRPWGKEIMLCKVPGAYTFKRLLMQAGTKGGLQYHHRKDEVGFVVSGELLVRYYDGNAERVLSERICKAGDVVHFPQGAIHQEEALTDCEILEVSTPFLNDRVRVEELFGLSKGEGLPSVTPEEVQSV